MMRQLETALRRLRRTFSRSRWFVSLTGLPTSDPGASASPANHKEASQVSDWVPGSQFRTGLLMVQIDGLGRQELEAATRRGDMPFLARLLEREHYQLHTLYSGLPSSTPSVQGELLYGVSMAVPAFAYLNRQDDSVHRMYDPASAASVERVLETQGEPLLNGGSAYCDIYTGGAAEAHFCAASMGLSDVLRDVRPLVWLGVAVMHLPTLLRALCLTILELVLAIKDMLDGWFSGFNWKAELKFVGARVAVSILLRDLITIGAKVDIARGLPIIHLNYIGYDEHAHRRGPDSAFARWSLKGIDRCIARLWSATHQSVDRHYDLWVYSDHGQERTTPYERKTGQSIEAAVRRALAEKHPEAASRLQSLDDRVNERSTRMLSGNAWQRYLAGDPNLEQRQNSVRSLVVAMGPVGHVYLEAHLCGEQTLASLARNLAEVGQVPGVLYLGSDGNVKAVTSAQRLSLPRESLTLLGGGHPFVDMAGDDLVSLVRHPDAGELVLLGWVAGLDAVSFAMENGSHAGVGPHETQAFSLLPADGLAENIPQACLRPLDLYNLARARRLSDHCSAPFSSSVVVSERRTRRAPRALRVMSYNVHSCIGMDSRIAPERIARVIARYEPDVVALQELDLNRQRTFGIDQAQIVASHLRMDYHFHPALQFREEEYGDAILTHLPIRISRSGSLPITRKGTFREPRGLQWLTLEIGGKFIQVFNTHLGLFTDERRSQIRQLMSTEWLEHPDCTGPIIVCGDFNATPGSPAMQSLSSKLDDVQSRLNERRRYTFPGRLPTLSIDHVLVSDGVRVVKVQVPCDQLTQLASDHLPLVVDLMLPD